MHYSESLGPKATRNRQEPCDLPVYRENHFLHATLDSVLRLQMSHAVRRLSVNGYDHVSDAQVGLGSFTPRGDLQSAGHRGFFFSTPNDSKYYLTGSVSVAPTKCGGSS